MRSIKEAKKVKEQLIQYCNSDWPTLQAKVEIVFHEKDLAIQLTFCKKPTTGWAREHMGFPLIIKHP